MRKLYESAGKTRDRVKRYRSLYDKVFGDDEIDNNSSPLSNESLVINEQQNKLILTHRQQAIIYFFKIQAKVAKPLSRKEQRELGGKKREQAFDTIMNPKGKNYKPLTISEINFVLPILENFPEAYKLAKEKLIELQKKS
ncbi:MAG TPA: hypothetical protein VK179_21295 [Bacteroidales bacterium]|nr:hypothetical protein [Bacteroidales bacterium]